ncbi:thermostable alpha-amylase [Serendipita vermifera]|nr:thermostable alpha-amylase [Serendipita vermifera]
MEQMLSWFAESMYHMWSRAVKTDHALAPLEPPPKSLQRFRMGEAGRNGVMVQFFEWDSEGDKKGKKSWWQIFQNSVDDLKPLGVGLVWLPPMNKAMHKDGRGYDAYDLWDLGEFNQKGGVATRWGTKGELIAAIKTAKEQGIDILVDAVLNHKMGADNKETVQAVEVNPQDRTREIGQIQDMEAWTMFTFRGRQGKYSTMTWNSDHFTGVDWDSRRKKNGIYRFTGPGAHQGWSHNVDNELGNYDYLLGVDIDHRHHEVQQDLKAWGPWVFETTGSAGGFRLDAIKHMDSHFLRDFLQSTRSAMSRQDLFAVGEYWVPNAKMLRKRMGQFTGELAFFDVPLHHTFHQASKAGHLFDLRTILDNSLMKICPDDAVTFVDNHDTVCVIGQSLESWVGPKFKPLAYALILLRPEGYPCVFYNDLYKPDIPEVAKQLRTLLLARKHVAYGPITDYLSQRNCIAWVRMGDEQHPDGCVVLLNNGLAESSLQIVLPKERSNTKYINILDPGMIQISDARGMCTFRCKPSTASVWIPTLTARHLMEASLRN